jgi:hypothetical protein
VPGLDADDGHVCLDLVETFFPRGHEEGLEHIVRPQIRLKGLRPIDEEHGFVGEFV